MSSIKAPSSFPTRPTAPRRLPSALRTTTSRQPLLPVTTHVHAEGKRFTSALCATHVNVPSSLFVLPRLPWIQRLADSLLRFFGVRAARWFSTRFLERRAKAWAARNAEVAADTLLRVTPTLLWQALCDQAAASGARWPARDAGAVLLGLVRGSAYAARATAAHEEADAQLHHCIATGLGDKRVHVLAPPARPSRLSVARAAEVIAVACTSDEALNNAWCALVTTAVAPEGSPTTFDENYLRRVAQCAAAPLDRADRARVWRALDQALGYLLPASVGLNSCARKALEEAVTDELLKALANQDVGDAQFVKDVPRAAFALVQRDALVAFPVSDDDPSQPDARRMLRELVDNDAAWYDRVAKLGNQTMLNALHQASMLTPAGSLVTVAGEPCMVVGVGGLNQSTLQFNLCRLSRDVVRVEAHHDRNLAYLELVGSPGIRPRGWGCGPASRLDVRFYVDIRRPGVAGPRVQVGGLRARGQAVRTSP